MGLKMHHLENCFSAAKKVDAKYIGLSIEHKGTPKREIIINPSENFEYKLEYYKKTYNDDLQHNFDPENVRIFSVTFGNTFSEIEEDLI